MTRLAKILAEEGLLSTRGKSAAKRPSRKDKRLKENLETYLHSIQLKEEKEMGPKWGKGGKYDPVADVGIWIGDDLDRRDAYNADVVLHFDGAGYDYFTYTSPLREFRRAVEGIAKKLGYHMEDLTNWSIGFYNEG